MTEPVQPQTQPQPRRRRHRTSVDGPLPETAPEVRADDAVALPVDAAVIQEAAYARLQPDQRAYAIEQDVAWPLWSGTHYYLLPREGHGGPIPGGWRVDWQQCMHLYALSDMQLADISRLAGIPQRTLEYHSSQMAWTTARNTYRTVREAEVDRLNLMTLSKVARDEAVRGYMGNQGMAVLQKAMSALMGEDVKTRDIPALLLAGMKMVGMGAEMPTEYRHSQVTPNAGGSGNTMNVLVNVTSQGEAERIMAELAARALTLREHLALPEPE